MRKLPWLDRSVQKLAVGAGAPVRWLVRSWVRGSVVAQSVVLCAIARALEPTRRGFHAALERLSEGLGKKNIAAIAQVGVGYLRRVGRWTRKGFFDVVAIDLSDIIKPYGRKMPYLSDVRDGSKSTRYQQVIGRGWQTVEIVAVDDKHRVLPLHRHPFSTEHPDFKSETNEVRRAFERVVPHLDRGVWGVLDRGFDGGKEFELLDEHLDHWCVRQRGDRQVFRPGSDEPERMQTLAQAVPVQHVGRISHVEHGCLVDSKVRFGFCTIDVPTEACRKYRRKPRVKRRGLVVVQHDRPAQPRMLLLINRPVRSAAEARRWVAAYRRRWGVEEETRAGKQGAELEDLRVLRWDAIVNLVALSVLTEGLLALLQVEAPRRAARLARLAPIVGDVPPFALYRIWMTVALMLRGALPAGR